MSSKAKPIKRNIIAILITLILTLSAYPLYMNGNSLQSIRKTGKNKTAVIEICGAENEFNLTSKPDNIISHKQHKENSCINIELPLQKDFTKYQFDIIAQNSGKIDIYLSTPESAKQNSHLWIWADFTKLEIDGKMIFNDTKQATFQKPYIYNTNIQSKIPLRISVSARKHHFSFSDLSKKYSLSWLILFTVIVIAYLLALKLVNYLAKFKLLEQNSRIDIVFLSIFFILLYVPMSNVSKEEISPNENRVLALKPQFIALDGVNNSFGIQFENWFNDRFFGRRFLLSIDEKLHGIIEPHRGNKKVMVGREGWLFYKGGNGINNFANKSRLGQHQLEQGLQYLASISEWCKAHNKKFYYVLVPDKNRVYGEYVKYIQKVRPDSESMDNQWLNYVRTNSDINVTYLYDVLIQNKDKGLLYWKEDTHWTDLGSYLSYQEIIKTIAKDMNITPYLVKEWQTETNPLIDLSRIYPYAKHDKNAQYQKPVMTDKNASCTQEDEAGINITICHNNNKPFRAFILRDSFSAALEKYYAETFGKVKLVWRYNITPEDLIDIAANYDIVIYENVSRFIPKVLNQIFPKD